MKKVFTSLIKNLCKLISFISSALNHKRVDLDKKKLGMHKTEVNNNEIADNDVNINISINISEEEED